MHQVILMHSSTCINMYATVYAERFRSLSNTVSHAHETIVILPLLALHYAMFGYFNAYLVAIR